MNSFPLTPFRYVGSQKLSGMLLQPYDLYKEGWADAYLMGMVNQVSVASTDKTGFDPEMCLLSIEVRSDLSS